MNCPCVIVQLSNICKAVAFRRPPRCSSHWDVDVKSNGCCERNTRGRRKDARKRTKWNPGTFHLVSPKPSWARSYQSAGLTGSPSSLKPRAQIRSEAEQE